MVDLQVGRCASTPPSTTSPGAVSCSGGRRLSRRPAGT